jgi:short-subunit dehydrogenase
MKKSPLATRVALITGASSGIGAAAARLLAGNGMHVLLVARRMDRLQDLEAEIRLKNGIVTVIPCDLSVESERINLYSSLQALNLMPDILINNAGIAWYGYFHTMPWDVAGSILHLNIEASTHLVNLFLPWMVQQHYGRVINIGSIAGKLPEQGIAVYSASKSFLDSFSTVVYRELRGTGVTSSIIRAGPVKTEFFDVARNQENGGSVPAERFAVGADRVAAAILSMVKRPLRVKYVPFYMVFSPLLEFFFSWIIDLVGPLLLRKEKPH